MKTFRDLFRRCITCETMCNSKESLEDFPFDGWFVSVSTKNTVVLYNNDDTTFYGIGFYQNNKVGISIGICEFPYDRTAYFYEKSGINWNMLNEFNLDDPISNILKNDI